MFPKHLFLKTRGFMSFLTSAPICKTHVHSCSPLLLHLGAPNQSEGLESGESAGTQGPNGWLGDNNVAQMGS